MRQSRLSGSVEGATMIPTPTQFLIFEMCVHFGLRSQVSGVGQPNCLAIPPARH